MGTEDAGSGQSPSPRAAGKQLPEKRKAFMIYLPAAVHARLRTEAIKRAVSMSEVASIAVAQFLVEDTAEAVTLVAQTPQPFVGSFGGERQTPKAKVDVPDAEVPTGPMTYEVE